MKIREKYIDFKCNCGCGQKMRFSFLCWKNGIILDVGYMKKGEKRPKTGIIIREDKDTKEFTKLIKFLTSVKVKNR